MRTGFTNVVIYRLKVIRSTVSIRPCMMRKPPTEITATERMHRKNSITALNRPMARWNTRLEVLKLSLDTSNFSSSASSLAKALAVLMPERPDSMSALMVAVRCFTLIEASCMDLRHFHTTRKNTGMMQAITRASCHWMVNMMASAPTMVTPEMKMSSGPWWASSVMSNRSAVRRLISWPVRLRS